ncbi:hypothetical protein MMC25_004333 [Agyrium rufum]|nr:hypothetical protein [Agyrium rufum]
MFLVKVPRDGSTVDLQPLLFTLFLDTATHFLFGEAIGVLSGEEPKNIPVDAQTFLKEFQNGFEGMGMRIISGRLSFLIPSKRWLASCAIVHKYIDFLTQRATETCKTTTGALKRHNSTNNTQSHSLLDSLLDLTDDSIEIRNSLLQGLMAAQETTSVLLSTTFFLLSRSPPTWAKLRRESMGLAASGVTFESLRSSRVLRNIQYESLRIYPVFSNIVRSVLRDTTLPTGGGASGQSPVFVSKGTTLLFSFYSLHRDPVIFGEDVEVFNPDRWEVIKPGACEFMVFGSGPRACLGQQKALIEASYFLVRMALEFERIESRDSRPWAAAERLTTSNANGCEVAFMQGAM